MKIWDNGIIRKMTEEEIAELEKMSAEQQPVDPTPEERMDMLENAFLELAEMIGGAK